MNTYWKLYITFWSILIAHFGCASPNEQRQQRDIEGQLNARDTIGNTLGHWRNGVLKFFSDGLRVDSEANDVTRNIHKFSRNIGEAGNAFVETVHGKGPRSFKTGQALHTSTTKPTTTTTMKPYHILYNEDETDHIIVASRRVFRGIPAPSSTLPSIYKDVRMATMPPKHAAFYKPRKLYKVPKNGFKYSRKRI